MFEINDDGSFLIKNSAVLGDAPLASDEAKKACHALSAHALVAKLKKEALLQERTESQVLGQGEASVRREALRTAAQKSTATSLEELENEVFSNWSSSQMG